MTEPRRHHSGEVTYAQSPQAAQTVENHLAERQQRLTARVEAEAKYKEDRLAAIKAGVPESALHPPTAGMDLKAANANLSYHTGGRGNANVDAGPVNRGPSSLDKLSTDWMGKEGISNPPPPNNLNGEYNASTLAKTVTVDPRQGATTPALTGNRATDDANQKAAVANNLDIAHHPTAARATPVAPGVPSVPPATNGAGPIARAAQLPAPEEGREDQQTRMGSAPSPAQGPIDRTAATDFGTGSVRYAPRAEGLLPKQDITGDDGTAIGVGRMSHDEMRADLYKRHPKIFEKDSPENAAYVAAARAHPNGEAGVYGGVNDLMASVQPAKPQTNPVAGPNASPATAHDDVNAGGQPPPNYPAPRIVTSGDFHPPTPPANAGIPSNPVVNRPPGGRPNWMALNQPKPTPGPSSATAHNDVNTGGAKGPLDQAGALPGVPNTQGPNGPLTQTDKTPAPNMSTAPSPMPDVAPTASANVTVGPLKKKQPLADL